MKEGVLSASSHLISHITSYNLPVMQPFLLSLFGLVWLSGFVHLPALIPTFLHCPCHPFACLKVNSRRFSQADVQYVSKQSEVRHTSADSSLSHLPLPLLHSFFSPSRPASSWYCFSSLPVLRLLSVLHLFLALCLFVSLLLLPIQHKSHLCLYI